MGYGRVQCPSPQSTRGMKERATVGVEGFRASLQMVAVESRGGREEGSLSSTGREHRMSTSDGGLRASGSFGMILTAQST